MNAERSPAGSAVAYVCADSSAAVAAQHRLDQLAAEAVWLGHMVHARVCDSASSFVPLRLRPGWATVVSTVEAGLAETVIVRSMSELAAGRCDRVPILGWLETAGARLVTLESSDAVVSWSVAGCGAPWGGRVVADDRAVLQVQEDYDAVPSSVPSARDMIQGCLAKWGRGSDATVVDAACLLVGELLANAIVHGCSSQDDTVTVLVECDAKLVRISVSDPCPRMPRPRSPSADDESGRGLHLIDAMADQWGVVPRAGAGKCVWFALNLGERAREACHV